IHTRRYRGEVHDGIVGEADAPPHRFGVRELERQPAHRFALSGRQVRRGSHRRRALPRPHRPVYLAPVGEQPPHQPATDESVGTGHQHLHDTRSKSASTIMRTSSAKLVRGAHSSSRRALPGSACRVSTSAGRTNRGSTVTYFCQSRPTCEKASSHNSRTECISPVPITWSPGRGGCSIRHLAST